MEHCSTHIWLVKVFCNGPYLGSEASLGGPRTTVFMIGGITYEEMAAAYEVSDAAKRPCYIGMACLLLALCTLLMEKRGGGLVCILFALYIVISITL
jgi:hypothetical protein